MFAKSTTIALTFVFLALVGACTSSQKYGQVQDYTPEFPRANTTYLSWTGFHGFQIEYLASSGKLFLWYPGNTRVVTGEWSHLLDKVCMVYQQNSYNPATRQKGGNWRCVDRRGLSLQNVAKLSGDVFGLSSLNKVPYVRSKCSYPDNFKLYRKVKCK